MGPGVGPTGQAVSTCKGANRKGEWAKLGMTLNDKSRKLAAFAKSGESQISAREDCLGWLT